MEEQLTDQVAAPAAAPFGRSRYQARRSSAMANLKEGFAYVWSTPAVLALMTLA